MNIDEFQKKADQVGWISLGFPSLTNALETMLLHAKTVADLEPGKSQTLFFHNGIKIRVEKKPGFHDEHQYVIHDLITDSEIYCGNIYGFHKGLVEIYKWGIWYTVDKEVKNDPKVISGFIRD